MTLIGQRFDGDRAIMTLMSFCVRAEFLPRVWDRFGREVQGTSASEASRGDIPALCKKIKGSKNIK